MAEDLDKLAQRIAALEATVRSLLGTQNKVETADVSSEEWQMLGEKLDKLEDSLSVKEKTVLMSILGAAAATYERAGNQESPATAARTPISLTGAIDKVRLSDGLKSIGSFQRPGAGSLSGGSPIADSVNVGGDFTSVHGDWTKDTGKASEAMIRGRWNALSQAGGLTTNPIAGGSDFGRSGGGGGFR